MDYRERYELKEYRNERRLDRRVRLVHGALVILMIAFGLNFWYLQVVQGERYAQLAENNRLRRIPLPPHRGEVLDREGRVLASTRPALNLVLNREDDRDVAGQLRRLAPILGTTVQELEERYRRMLTRPAYEPLVLREDVSLEELARIESRREQFPSVEVHQAAVRSYVSGASAAHALGYVGEVSGDELSAQDGAGLERGDIVGKSGVERTYDDLLRGHRGWLLVSVNNVGRRLGRGRVGEAPVHGRPIELTLDLRLQQVLADAFGDDAGAGVFMDPWTGEVLALVSAPAYDPNEFVRGISRDVWAGIQDDPQRPMHNRGIASFYAPGSTFKVLMAIAGLESGGVSKDTRVFCNGSTVIYGQRRLCWKRGGHGWVDLQSALTHSCNVYFYKLGQTLGIDPITRYGAMFGFGSPTGVDLPGESGGILPSDAWKRRAQGEPWYPGDTISVAIGQGLLAVTPLQMARFMSAVATSGTLPYPHLLKDNRRPAEHVAVSASTFAVVRAALADVVSEGTGTRAALAGIEVAGKTGTAQVYKKSAGIDADLLPKEERDHAWFVGFAPVDHPRIAFAVVVEHGGHGGTTAAPIARKVLEAFFEGAAPEAPPQRPELRAGLRPAPPEPVHDGSTATR